MRFLIFYGCKILNRQLLVIVELPAFLVNLEIRPFPSEQAAFHENRSDDDIINGEIILKAGRLGVNG